MDERLTRLQGLLDNAVCSAPEKIALRIGNSCTNYQKLDQMIGRAAAGFLDENINRGDRIAWLLPNCLEAVLVTLACYRIGAIAVPLNYRYVSQEIQDVLMRVGASLIVYDAARSADVQHLLDALPMVSAVEVRGDNSTRFNQWLEGEAQAEKVPVKENEPALILFTSGSTGHPKGVVHSQEGVYEAIDQSRSLFDFNSEDIVLVGKSISHAGGLQTQMLPALLAGGEVILEMKPTPAEAVQLINAHQVTEYGLLASDLLDFVEYLESTSSELPSLNNAIGSGDAVPTDLHRRFRDCLGWEVMEGAGMTEVGCYYAANPRNGPRKWGSLGIAAPGMRLDIVRSDGSPCDSGEHGEIVLQAESATIGYWNDSVATQELFRNEWLHTGDLAYRDDDGYIWFVGRKKLMIIRRGSNIAPAEVEAIIDEHPLVHASVVVAVSDPRDGQIPVACVALLSQQEEDTEQTLRCYVEQHLAGYKNPVHYLFLEVLPRTSTGKFDRHALAELAGSQFVSTE